MGVDIFVLISGYFLVTDDTKKTNIKKLFRIHGEIFFYSVSIYIICRLAGVENFEIKSFIKTILPITFSSWWFASTYFVLFLVHPLINLLVKELDKKTYQKVLTFGILMWSVIPTFTLQSNQSNELIWFCVLYCTAGYIKLHGRNSSFTVKSWIIAFFIFTLIQFILDIWLIVSGIDNSNTINNALNGIQSVFTFGRALSLFMCFTKMQCGRSMIVNTIASTTFGVYLIHDNNIIRPLLWQHLFKNCLFRDSITIIPYSLLFTVLIFFSCLVIDLLRMHTIEKWYMRIVNSVENKCMTIIGHITLSIFKMVDCEKNSSD